MIGSKHVIWPGQCWDEVTEHERASRETVQQQDHGRSRRSGLSVEQLPSLDGRVTMMNGRHRSSNAVVLVA
jgi:hypothetical protein